MTYGWKGNQPPTCSREMSIPHMSARGLVGFISSTMMTTIVMTTTTTYRFCWTSLPCSRVSKKYKNKIPVHLQKLPVDLRRYFNTIYTVDAIFTVTLRCHGKKCIDIHCCIISIVTNAKIPEFPVEKNLSRYPGVLDSLYYDDEYINNYCCLYVFIELVFSL